MSVLSQASNRIYTNTVDPGLSEPGVEVGNFFLNTASGQAYVNVVPTLGAQVWKRSNLPTSVSNSALITDSSGVPTYAAGVNNSVLTGATAAQPSFSTTSTSYFSSISFDAGSTLMSHYQENVSFTPTISGSTIAGAGTYTTQSGYYCRVGNLILLQGQIVWTAHTGTGDMLITGLPFTCRNQVNYNPEIIVNAISVPLPAAGTSVRGEVQTNSTQVNLSVIVSNGANSPVAMNATGTIHLSGWYLT